MNFRNSGPLSSIPGLFILLVEVESGCPSQPSGVCTETYNWKREREMLRERLWAFRRGVVVIFHKAILSSYPTSMTTDIKGLNSNTMISLLKIFHSKDACHHILGLTFKFGPACIFKFMSQHSLSYLNTCNPPCAFSF